MQKLVCEICGMNINDKNYDYNNKAFLQQNDLEYIRYCPFCGAAEVYIGEDFQTINVSSEKLDDTTLNILDHAVKLEIFNGDFYAEASKICSNKENSDIFKALSNIEYMHARIHLRLGGFKHLPEISKLDYSKYKGKDNDLFNQAEIREIHAVEYYNKNINLVDNEEIKKVFRALSMVEKDHIKLTDRK